MNRTKAITKILSKNDAGETGGHQAGMHIPKQAEILSFFPDLGCTEKNPRCVLLFTDSLGEQWSFSFIYYNNRLFGGTRNEYRLTGMTKFFQSHNLKSGDSLLLRRDGQDNYHIEYTRKTEKKHCSTERLVLNNSWKVISI